ncbi:MAG: hypothetical protein ACKVOG_00660 [Rhodoglobus sp.]
MSSASPVAGPQAAARVARTITIVAAVATLVFFALSVGPIITAASHVVLWYNLVSAALVFGLPPAVAVIGLFASLTTLRRILGAYALVFLLIVAAWVPALTSPLPPGLAPWPLEVTALATVPAAIAWRPALVWLYLVVNSLIIAPVRYLSSGQMDWTVPLQYAFFTLTFAAIFTALAMVAMRNGYALDAATELARVTSARAAAALSRSREQSRLDALVHDTVMGTLFYASRGGLDESVRRQAVRALTQLEQLRGGREVGVGDVSAEDFVTRIRSVVLDGSSEIDFMAVGSRNGGLPPEVVDAFAEATSEAVRNSLQHAVDPGTGVARAAVITLAESSVRITFSDNAQGFDPRDVAPHRLGIVVSIRGRLGTIPGGAATVESGRDAGTVVTLSWTST